MKPKWHVLAVWATPILALGAAPPSGHLVAGGAGFTHTQHGRRQPICEELERDYVVKESQRNSRVLNFSLFQAAERGCMRFVVQLLAEGASIRARDRFGNTALLRAARTGENDVVRLLLARGADVHQQNLAGSTALLRAVTMNRRRTAKILLEAGADPNTPNRGGITPLIAAAYNGEARNVNQLLAAGSRPEVRDATGKTAIVYAAGRGYTRIVAGLLDAGVDLNERFSHALTVLMWAAGHSNDVPVEEGLETVRLVVTRGAALNLADDRGRTALIIAAERGHSEIVSLLVDAGADGSHRDAAGNTASDVAGNDAVLKALHPHIAPGRTSAGP